MLLTTRELKEASTFWIELVIKDAGTKERVVGPCYWSFLPQGVNSGARASTMRICVDDGLGSLFRVVGLNPTVEAFFNLLSAQARQHIPKVFCARFPVALAVHCDE